MYQPTRFASTPVGPPPTSQSHLFQTSSPQPSTSRMRSPGSFTPSPVPQQHHPREASYPNFNSYYQLAPNCGQNVGAGSYPGYSGGGVNYRMKNPCQVVDLHAPSNAALYQQQLQLQFFSDFSDKLSKKDEEIGKLKAKVSHSDKELKEIKSRSQTYTADLITLTQVKAEMGTSMSKLDEMTKMKDEHERKLADASKQIAALTEEKEGLIAEKEMHLERIRTLEGAAEVSARQLVEKTSELEAESKQRRAIENELKECKTKLEEELKSKEDKGKEFEKSISSLKTQMETLENDLKLKLTEKTMEVENGRKEKMSVESDLKEHKAKQEETLKEKEENEKAQEQLIQSLRIRLEAAEMNLRGMQNAVGRDDPIIQRLTQENAQLQRTIVRIMQSTQNARIWSERLEAAKHERQRMADKVINMSKMFTRDSDQDRENERIMEEFVLPHPVFKTPPAEVNNGADIIVSVTATASTHDQSTASQASSEPAAGPSSACILPVDEAIQDSAFGHVGTSEEMVQDQVQPAAVVEMRDIKQEVVPSPSPKRNSKRIILNAHCAPDASPSTSANSAEKRTCVVEVSLLSDDSSDEREQSARPVTNKKTSCPEPEPKKRRVSQRRKIPKKR